MSFVQVLSIGFALAACVAPVLLLLRPDGGGLSVCEADRPVPPAIIRNAWIAYAVRVSVFVPLFASGVAGDVWPAIAGAAGFAAGIGLLGALRGPIAAFGDEARRRAEPATLHAFLAQTSGGAFSLRRTSAMVTVVALLGFAGGEAAALVVVVTPLLGDGFGIVCFVTLVVLACLLAGAAGTNGVRYVSQALLGAIHIGVLGSAAFLLYLNASDLRPMPPHGAFALIALTACCVAILIYRQTKYVETPHLVLSDEPSRWRRTVGRQIRLLQRFANVVISVLAVLAVVMAGMALYALGVPDTLRNGLAALGTAHHVPAIGLAGIAVLALTCPLVDVVSWQSVGALAESARIAGGEAGTKAALFRRPMRMVARETALFGVVFAGFGAVAALSTDLPPDATGMGDFVRQLIVFENEISDVALTLLLVGVFAMAASTMGMAISSAMTTIRLDIPRPPRAEMDEANDATSTGRTAAASATVLVVAISAIWIASGVPSSGLADARFFALVLAFACLQVSLLPLLLARLGGLTLPGAGAALIVIGGGAAAGLSAIAIHGATADLLWLWLAVPACLVSGLLLLAAATLWRTAYRPT